MTPQRDPDPGPGPSKGEGDGVQTSLTVSVVLLCGLGMLAVSSGPGFRSGFATAFWVAAALRLLFARGGRPLGPRRVLLPLGCTVSAVACAFLFEGLRGHTGLDALWTLMCITAVFEALVLLWRPTTFSSFLLILFSSVHAAGIAFAHEDATGLVYIAANVVALVWTLVLFERRATLDRAESTEGNLHRVRARGAPVLPWWAAARVTLVLVVFGLPLGALLYLAAPRGFGFGSLLRSNAEHEDPSGAATSAGIALGEAASARTEFAFAGPGGDGAPLGSVAEIKRNFEPWFEVGLLEGGRMPPTVVLRDNARDYYDPRGIWMDTLSSAGRDVVYRDIDDGRRDGWIPLAFGGRKDGETLRIELLRGGQTRLYLQPDEVGLEIQRDGKALTRVTIREKLGKMFDTSRPLKAGDVILQRYVAPLASDALLVGRRSSSAVVPLTSYLQVPDVCAAPLRARAERIVGTETDPWRRARRIEAWLKSEAFTYSLKIPRLDRANPIVDFVERTRTGNCEAFAYAQTLMLRTLGHPARYVRGFWGGDRQEQRKTVILRGVHYHAWTEMFLEGAGWVPLNPTPPDRRAVDADTLTAAKAAWEHGDEDASEPWSWLGYDQAGWRAFWRNVARGLDRYVVEPVGVLFTPRGGFSGVPLLLLLLVLLRRGRQRARLEALVVPPGGRLPAGAYGQALLLLARKGIRRRPNQTVREYLRHVAQRLPPAVPALKRLTVLHEAQRYGGRAHEAQRAEAARMLQELRGALKPQRAR